MIPCILIAAVSLAAPVQALIRDGVISAKIGKGRGRPQLIHRSELAKGRKRRGIGNPTFWTDENPRKKLSG